MTSWRDTVCGTSARKLYPTRGRELGHEVRGASIQNDGPVICPRAPQLPNGASIEAMRIPTIGLARTLNVPAPDLGHGGHSSGFSLQKWRRVLAVIGVELVDLRRKPSLESFPSDFECRGDQAFLDSPWFKA